MVSQEQILKANNIFATQTCHFDTPLSFIDNFQELFWFSVQELKHDSLHHLDHLNFLLHSFQHLDHPAIRKECFKLVGVSLLAMLSEPERCKVFNTNPRIQILYGNFISKNALFDSSSMLQLIFNIYKSQQSEIVGKLLELLSLLMSMLPTRKYLMSVMKEYHIVPLFWRNCLVQESMAWKQFLYFYTMPIDDFQGQHLPVDEFFSIKKAALSSLQRDLFQFTKDDSIHKEFCSAPIALSAVKEWFHKLNGKIDLMDFFKFISVRTKDLKDDEFPVDLIIESQTIFYNPLIISQNLKQVNFNEVEPTSVGSLFPTEEDLMQAAVLENDACASSGLPFLGIQFLSQRDYLMRNFSLLKSSASFDIKEDVENCISHMQPFLTQTNETAFAGWSRFCLAIEKFQLEQQSEQLFSLSQLPTTKAKIVTRLERVSELLQKEWSSFRPEETLYLLQVTADNTNPHDSKANVKFLRCCSHLQTESSDGTLTFIVSLDSTQVATLPSDTSFNLIMRRNPKENNFKWTLELLAYCVENNLELPDVFKNVFLGYGNPTESTASSIPTESTFLGDAIIDMEHLKMTFPDWLIDAGVTDVKNLQFNSSTKTISQSPQTFFNSISVTNEIRFTPIQIKAIISASSPGLTLLVGPPGTGKTDIISQTIKNIYCSNSQERILIVTHSNHALNVLFQNLTQSNTCVDMKDVVRLGHGEEELHSSNSLSSAMDFSKYGRMNEWMQFRIELLETVKQLATALGYSGDYFVSSCENAIYFEQFYLNSLIEQCEQSGDFGRLEKISESGIFLSSSDEQASKDSNGNLSAPLLISLIRNLFIDIKSCLPFEILRNDYDRSKYFLSCKSRIVAVTSTFLAVRHHELSSQFQTVIIEEAGQLLDIECLLISLAAGSSLRRLVLVGDHHQLPPVVKSKSLRVYSNLDQSLFVRLLRNGTGHIQLQEQARCRPEIVALYSHLYIPHLLTLTNHSYAKKFASPNPCLLHTLQFINVPDLNGFGETEPVLHSYQNLAEAEWIVALYQYLVLNGYPSQSIALLSTYNGQVALIREILTTRCTDESLFSNLPTVSTVDKFQGRQADYVLLSLVRTKLSPGHITDLRRFTVAMSRARLGLYIFGRASLFVNRLCEPIGEIFVKNLPAVGPLFLVRGEQFQDTCENTTDNTEVRNTRIVQIKDAIEMFELVKEKIKGTYEIE